jgi:hypothetical protein
VVQLCSELVIVVHREDAEVHLHALQTMIQQFQLCEWGHCRLVKQHRCSEVTSGSWDAPDYPIFLDNRFTDGDGSQPYAPASLYPQEDFWYSFLLEAESTPGPWHAMIRSIEKSNLLIRKEFATFRLVA